MEDEFKVRNRQKGRNITKSQDGFDGLRDDELELASHQAGQEEEEEGDAEQGGQGDEPEQQRPARCGHREDRGGSPE